MSLGFSQGLELNLMMTKRFLNASIIDPTNDFTSFLPYIGRKRSKMWRDISESLESQEHEASIINSTNRGCLKERILDLLSQSVKKPSGPYLLFIGVGAGVNEKLIADIVCTEYKRCEIGILDGSIDNAEIVRDRLFEHLDDKMSIFRSDIKIFNKTFENFSLQGIHELRKEIGDRPILAVSLNNTKNNRKDIILNEKPYTDFSYSVVFANLCREQDILLCGEHTFPKLKQTDNIDEYRKHLTDYMEDSYKNTDFREWMIDRYKRKYKMVPEKVRVEIEKLYEQLEEGFTVEPKYDVLDKNNLPKTIPLYVSGKLTMKLAKELFEKANLYPIYEFQSENEWHKITIAKIKEHQSTSTESQMTWFKNAITENYEKIKNNYPKKELALIEAIKKTTYQIKDEKIIPPYENNQDKAEYLKNLELVARNFGIIVSLSKKERGIPCRYQTELQDLARSFNIK
jgi:hypothetical protein